MWNINILESALSHTYERAYTVKSSGRTYKSVNGRPHQKKTHEKIGFSVGKVADQQYWPSKIPLDSVELQVFIFCKTSPPLELGRKVFREHYILFYISARKQNHIFVTFSQYWNPLFAKRTLSLWHYTHQTLPPPTHSLNYGHYIRTTCKLPSWVEPNILGQEFLLTVPPFCDVIFKKWVMGRRFLWFILTHVLGGEFLEREAQITGIVPDTVYYFKRIMGG